MNISERDEEVKSAILSAAKRVFQKWGMNKATMEDIAEEAGKGKSTLYNYYQSKEQIFESLAMQEFANILERAKLATSSAVSAKEKLKLYMATVLVEMKKTVGVSPIIFRELKGKKDFVTRVAKQMDTYEERIVRDILHEGIRSGEFTKINKRNVEKAASVVVGIIRGLELHLFLEIDELEKIEIATAFLTGGI